MEVAKELINANADVNVKDKEGFTALIWALKNDHKEIANLIRASARISLVRWLWLKKKFGAYLKGRGFSKYIA